MPNCKFVLQAFLSIVGWISFCRHPKKCFDWTIVTKTPKTCFPFGGDWDGGVELIHRSHLLHPLLSTNCFAHVLPMPVLALNGAQKRGGANLFSKTKRLKALCKRFSQQWESCVTHCCNLKKRVFSDPISVCIKRGNKTSSERTKRLTDLAVKTEDMCGVHFSGHVTLTSCGIECFAWICSHEVWSVWRSLCRSTSGNPIWMVHRTNRSRSHNRPQQANHAGLDGCTDTVTSLKIVRVRNLCSDFDGQCMKNDSDLLQKQDKLVLQLVIVYSGLGETQQSIKGVLMPEENGVRVSPVKCDGDAF